MESAPEGFTWCGRKADLCVYLTNIEFQGGEGAEPALYIRNENRKNDQGGCPVYMVVLQDLWIYRPEDRDRGRNNSYAEMQQRLANASVALYGLDVASYRYRILDVILDFADDLKNLKPPADMTKAQWMQQLERHRVTLRVNGEKVIG